MKLLKKLFLVFLLLALCIAPAEATKFGVVSPVTTGIVKYPTWEKLHEYTYTAVDTDTKLLLHFTGKDGAVATNDSATGKAVTFVGTAQIDTAYSPFTGGSSLLLDGNSDYVTLADSADWNFGTGDFTIECFVRMNDLTGSQTIFGHCNAVGTDHVIIQKGTPAGGNKLAMVFVIGGVAKGNYEMASSWSVSVDTWYHITFERTTTTAKIFIDGVSQTLTETTAFGTNDIGDVAGVASIGTYLDEGTPANSYVKGNIAELRITKGVARWTSNFTPPTSPYIGNTAYEILNLDGDTDQMYMLDCFVVNNYSTGVAVSVKMNNDTGANYGGQRLYGGSTSIGADRSAIEPGFAMSIGGASGDKSQQQFVIYAKSGFVRTALHTFSYGISTTTVGYVFSNGKSWNNTTDNITSITFVSSNANALGTGTRISLYRKVYR